MNNAINEIKNQETKNQEPLKRTKSRIMEAEDRISEVEDRMVEINETERKKRIKRNEDSLRELWNNNNKNLNNQS